MLRTGSALVERPVGRLDDQSPTVGHGVAGIDAQVQERVLQLAWIGTDRPHADAGDDLKVNLRTNGSAD